MLFFSLELLSFSLFYLIGMLKERGIAQEAILKFFILSLLSSTVLLLGIAILYGQFKTTSLITLGERMSLGYDLTTKIGLGLILAGLGFKLVFVPFHLWTPDVFLGAPLPVVTLLAGGPKIAGFAALFNILNSTIGDLTGLLLNLLLVMSLVTMLAGNLAALREPNLKRMLAFSAIAHVGYILIGFVVWSVESKVAILFYLTIYLFMITGAFASLHLLGEGFDLEKIKGLSKTEPGVAFMLSLFLVSLAGIPPTGGFIVKLKIFMAALRAGHGGLVLFALINSVIAAYYYLRVVVFMFVEIPEKKPSSYKPPWFFTVLTLTGFIVVFSGLYPSPLLSLIRSFF
jgi:NADH-quinone oxidoreductase subunit N